MKPLIIILLSTVIPFCYIIFFNVYIPKNEKRFLKLPGEERSMILTRVLKARLRMGLIIVIWYISLLIYVLVVKW